MFGVRVHSSVYSSRISDNESMIDSVFTRNDIFSSSAVIPCVAHGP